MYYIEFHAIYNTKIGAVTGHIKTQLRKVNIKINSNQKILKLN